MKRHIIIAGLVLIAMQAGCSGISVETDFDRDADFTLYRTYAWVKHDRQDDSGLMKDPLVQKHIRRAIETELAARGYRLAETGRPDFLVAWHIGSRKKIDVDHYYYGYGRFGGWGGHDVRVHRYREGTLIIDIVDAAQKELVWRGHAKSVLHGRERAADDINRIVEKIIERFPPDR
ncbi:MAG TPA: DUF4136 domain-containing protein [Candidatus Krumholzibacterium sp.]|nr:DUF4136 domain-containing protein [Candidatus Krumholzibacterium sp.]